MSLLRSSWLVRRLLSLLRSPWLVRRLLSLLPILIGFLMLESAAERVTGVLMAGFVTLILGSILSWIKTWYQSCLRVFSVNNTMTIRACSAGRGRLRIHKIFSQQKVCLFLVFLVLGPFPLGVSARPMPRGRPATGSKAESEFIFLGDSYLGTEGSLVLTREVPRSSGRVFYKDQSKFIDSLTRGSASFRSSFVHSIRPSLTSSQGDGVAFVITANPWSVNSPNALAIKLETASNKVLIDVGNIISVVSADAGSSGIDLRAGIPVTFLIEYDSSVKVLKVWFNRSLSPILVVPNLDLFHILEEYMYVGFIAYNGKGGRTEYIIRYWSFEITRFSPGPAPSPGTEERRKFRVKVWISVVVGFLILSLILALVGFKIYQHQKTQEPPLDSTNYRRAGRSYSEQYRPLNRSVRRRTRRITIP